MPRTVEGLLIPRKGARFGIVVARTNALVTERLVAGCLDAWKRHGVEDRAVDLVWVPGAIEIPVALQALARTKKHAALAALGCVIRGGTPHFEYVAGEAARGVGQVALECGIPVAFGILTCDNLEQALERAGAKGGNKGWEAGMSALEMADLLPRL